MYFQASIDALQVFRNGFQAFPDVVWEGCLNVNTVGFRFAGPYLHGVGRADNLQCTGSVDPFFWPEPSYTQ